MGAYLSQPVTEKEAFDGNAPGVRYGVAAMQGWRRNMEDAHVVSTEIGNYDGRVSVFGVFDGHGGSEVARFCQKYIPKELAAIEGFPEEVENALVTVFHRMDDMLRDASYQSELEQLKNKPESDEEMVCEEGAPHSPAEAVLKQLHLVRKLICNGGGLGAGGDPQLTPGANGGAPGGRVGELGACESAVQAGATAIVAVKIDSDLVVANTGDSRGVLSRGGVAVPMSEDHKPGLERERARIVAAGGFLSEIAGMCRVNGNLNLSRAIGDLKYKGNTKLKAKDQIITAEPDVRRFSLQPDDQFFVLACDGVWDVMDNQQVVNYVSRGLREGKSISLIGSELLDECLAPDPKLTRGVGCDNMTILIGILERGEGEGA